MSSLTKPPPIRVPMKLIELAENDMEVMKFFESLLQSVYQLWANTDTHVGFYGVTPVAQASALTTTLTTITHTAPGTPDYAIQDLTTTTPYGFVSQDEGNTVLSVIANLQTRVDEVETILSNLGLTA